MKMKRFLSLVLAMVMSLALAAPATATAASLDDGDSQVSPRYAVYTMTYSLYMGCNTFLDVDFAVAYKGGNYVFERVDRVDLTHGENITLYYECLGYSSRLSSTVCELTVSRREMNGGIFTGYADTVTYMINIDAVMGRARESGPDFLSPVSVVVDETYGFASEPVLIHAE